MYYEDVHIYSASSLERFSEVLHAADRRWDSIRRIPYSAPGRWVQTLDLCDLKCNLWSEICHVDALLARLFPLLPSLRELALNSTIAFSRRITDGFSNRDGTGKITSLKGIHLTSSADLAVDDPFVEVLRCCPNLEELEIFGAGVGPLLVNNPPSIVDLDALPVKPLHLCGLRKLSMVSMYCSPVMLALLRSPLPCLRHLTLTPYDDISVPTSLVPRFIAEHGSELTSLHLFAPKTSWPTVLFPSPVTILHDCPKLNHLSLENPLPELTIPSFQPHHPLQILSLPRPDPRFFRILEPLLPSLPALKVVRARDVRWLRAGMSSHAQEAGVQGEMREWRRRLARRGIAVLDATWTPGGT